MITKSKKSQILLILENLYPDARTELNFKNEFELIIAIILSAQCTDKKVNEISPNLFLRFPTFLSLSLAKLEEVEMIIRQVNYYKTKSRNLISLSNIILTKYHGVLPKIYEELILLPGIGRKTANVFLGELGAKETIAVDTHVYRLSRRLGFSAEKTPLGVEIDLMNNFPSSKWKQLHHSLVLHGRRVCKAQNPGCNVCTLNRLCISSQITN